MGQYFVHTLYAIVDLQKHSIKQNRVKVEAVNYGQYSETSDFWDNYVSLYSVYFHF